MKSQPVATEFGPSVATSQSRSARREYWVRPGAPETVALLTATAFARASASEGESQWWALLTTT